LNRSRDEAALKDEPSKLWETLYADERLARHASMYTWPARRIGAGWVLDVGCEFGFGSLLIAMANPALRVAGLDVDFPTLRFSKQEITGTNGLRLNADGFRLPFASESVGGIYLINLLNLLAEPGDVLSEAWRVLVFGGTAIVSVPRDENEGPRQSLSTDINRLASEMGVFFPEFVCPPRICGLLPSCSHQSFRLDEVGAPWMALGRKQSRDR
jgi:SAM-dependent methyltransferase